MATVFHAPYDVAVCLPKQCGRVRQGGNVFPDVLLVVPIGFEFHPLGLLEKSPEFGQLGLEFGWVHREKLWEKSGRLQVRNNGKHPNQASQPVEQFADGSGISVDTFHENSSGSFTWFCFGASNFS